MRAQYWKWTTMVSAGAVMALVYRELKERARLLRQGAHDEDLLDGTLDDSFPASDPPSHTPMVGSKAH